jgi:hypothetical protein
MHAKYFNSAVATVAVVVLSSTCVFASSHAMPEQPADSYWQAPDFNFRSPDRTAPPVYSPPRPERPVRNKAYRAPLDSRPPGSSTPPPAPAFRPPYPVNTGAYQPYMDRPGANTAPTNRNFPPPPRRPYYGPDNGASAYNMPGYNPNRNYRRNNRWNNNKFWGRSGPSTWMNPGKRNWENSWDDMMNAPSRMGEMPGGWTAPEVTVPNPIDMGDQMQDNVKDLPEQIKDMDVDN